MPRRYAECSKVLRMQHICMRCRKSAASCPQCRLDASKSCYTKFVGRCSTSKHRVTKVLRMHAGHAIHLLQEHKKIKTDLIVSRSKKYYKQSCQHQMVLS